MSYLLDTNVFIQAKNLHYGLDFCPAFWDWLVQKGYTGVVFSIDKVADEIKDGQDELSIWAKDYGHVLFKPTLLTMVPQFTQVSTWVMEQNYTPAAINTFFQEADFYLIVHALAGNHVMVTHEVFSNSIHRIKIPNVCLGLGINYTSPYQMLRNEQARFVLGV